MMQNMQLSIQTITLKVLRILILALGNSRKKKRFSFHKIVKLQFLKLNFIKYF